MVVNVFSFLKNDHDAYNVEVFGARDTIRREALETLLVGDQDFEHNEYQITSNKRFWVLGVFAGTGHWLNAAFSYNELAINELQDYLEHNDHRTILKGPFVLSNDHIYEGQEAINRQYQLSEVKDAYNLGRAFKFEKTQEDIDFETNPIYEDDKIDEIGMKRLKIYNDQERKKGALRAFAVHQYLPQMRTLTDDVRRRFPIDHGKPLDFVRGMRFF